MQTQTSPNTLKGELTGKQPIQLAAAAVGVVFFLVGVLGFVPGVTTNLGDIEFFGHESDTRLLGIFAVNIGHNLVHLLFGVAGLVAARTVIMAKSFLIYGGAVYFVLWAYGLLIDLDSALNFANFNTADNWLHFALGALMVGTGVALSKVRK